MRKETLATGGGIGASLLIASCCLAPTLFVLFGLSVGGLAALASLEPYRPLFIAAGGLSLLYAGSRLRAGGGESGGAECSDPSCAPEEPGRRRTRRLLVLAVVLYAAAIAYPYVVAACL
jgi:mercuric ion transport protein